MSDTQLRVLSLNCWGLKFVAKNRSERIIAIAGELAKFNHDIIALQEIWVFADYAYIKECVSKRLPYAKFFYSGALGAGLALFSRFPIIAASVHPYSLNGEPIDVSAGDWFVGKAAASIIISHPVLTQVQIFNTHLYAKGGDDGPEHLRAHRLVNAWEFAKLAREAAELGRYVIAAGDFNSIPTTLPMTIIRDHAALTDAWSITHPNRTSPNSSSNVSPPLEAVTRYGVTADSPLNSYSAGKALDPHARKFCGKRLDYIFYRQPNRPYASSDQKIPILTCTESKVVLTENIPGYDFSFSDHFGLEATLEFSIPENEEHSSGSRPYAIDAYNSSSSSISSTRSQNTPSLSSGSITTTIQALTACYRFSRHRARQELTIFSFCILLLIALIVGSSWISQPWINPLLLIFTVFIAWLATTMFYEGFLYGKWEVNALVNVIEELEILRKGLVPRRPDATS